MITNELRFISDNQSALAFAMFNVLGDLAVVLDTELVGDWLPGTTSTPDGASKIVNDPVFWLRTLVVVADKTCPASLLKVSGEES
jgi:hypothetical protein